MDNLLFDYESNAAYYLLGVCIAIYILNLIKSAKEVDDLNTPPAKNQDQ